MDRSTLKEILAIQSYSGRQFRMFAYIIRQCKKNGWHYFTHNGNVYVTKGNSQLFPCVVAHMDTVHKIVSNLSIVEFNNRLTGFNAGTMEQTGIGGDDKVGVFIALECLKSCDNIKVAFFRDEETGCQGSKQAKMKFFKNCSYVLQADRRGNSDFITVASGTELSSSVFQMDVLNIISQYGYSFENGMMTDVMKLKENGLKVSCANVSCGYYNPHSDKEFVDMDDVEWCLNMFQHIIFELGTTRYPHKYTYRSIYSSYSPKNSSAVSPYGGYHSNYSSSDGYDDYGDWYNGDGTIDQEYQHKLTNDKEYQKWKNKGWDDDLCVDCNGPDPLSNGLCKNCQPEVYGVGQQPKQEYRDWLF